MKRFLLLSWLLTSSPTYAAHPFLCCDSVANKVCVVSTAGKIEWEYSVTHPQDCWQMPNGNYLFCFKTGALEVKPDKTKVWEYQAPEKTEIHACQPLPDGMVLLAETGTARLIEVGRDGKIVKEIKLSPGPKVSTHDQFRGTRKTREGHYLVCFKGDHKVVEVNGEGKIIREIPTEGDVHEVIPLPKGHLLLSCGEGHKVIELDKAGKTVWELNQNDLPGNPLQLAAGCQVLPNGNLIICNYLGHGHLGTQPQFVEITREKKIVWEFADHQNFKSVNQIQLLDVKGNTIKGEILR
jgi:hypothetical protein